MERLTREVEGRDARYGAAGVMTPYRICPRSDDDIEARAPSRKPLLVACVVMTAVVAFALYGLVVAFGTGAWITAPMLAVSLGWIIAAFRRVADAKYRAQVEARADALLAMMR